MTDNQITCLCVSIRDCSLWRTQSMWFSKTLSSRDHVDQSRSLRNETAKPTETPVTPVVPATVTAAAHSADCSLECSTDQTIPFTNNFNYHMRKKQKEWRWNILLKYFFILCFLLCFPSLIMFTMNSS